MKLSFLFLIFFLTIATSCKKRNNYYANPTAKFLKINNYLKENNLKNSVLQYSEAQFQGVTSDKKWDCKDVYQIDSEGNLIESKHYGEEGKRFVIMERVTIDDFIRMTTNKSMELHNHYNYNNDMIGSYKIESSIENRILIQKTFDGLFGEIEEIAKSTYDNHSNLVQVEKYDVDNKLKSKETYKYDKFNNRIEENTYDVSKDLKNPYIKVVYKYDKFGNRTNENHFSLKAYYKLEDPKYVWKYVYDNKGNWIIKFDYASDNTIPYMREERTFTYKNSH